MGLSDGQKSFRIRLAVLRQYRSVTDTQPATQPASHVAVAITLNAQASSLKTRGMTVTGHRKYVLLSFIKLLSLENYARNLELLVGYE